MSFQLRFLPTAQGRHARSLFQLNVCRQLSRDFYSFRSSAQRVPNASLLNPVSAFENQWLNALI